MSIGFPNQSRSYDPARHAVLFWGSDGAMEASFLLTQNALQFIEPGLAEDEKAMLRAFDLHRDRILAAAAKVYGRGRKGIYELHDSDFR